MENWARAGSPFQRISLSPTVCRSHMNAGSSAKKGGGLLSRRNQIQPARMCGDLKRFGSKHVYRCNRQGKKGGRKKSGVLTNDSFGNEYSLSAQRVFLNLRGKEVLIILSWIPPGRNIISEPGPS